MSTEKIMTLTPEQKAVLLELIQSGQPEMAIERCVEMCQDNLAATLLERGGYGTLQLAEHPLDIPRMRFVPEGQETPVYAARIAGIVVRRG